MPIIKNFDDLECTLEPLDKVKFDPSKRYAFKLKSNANNEEVKHFAEYVFTRLFAYQVGNYYDFKVKLPKSHVTVKHDFNADINNQVNNITESINRYIVNIKTKIKNEYPDKNNGKEEIEVDWYGALSFVSTYELERCGYINTEDLRFNKKEADFYGRSMMAKFLQKYATEHHPDKFARNFEIYQAEDSNYTGGFEKVVKQQRDLSLNSEQQVEVLKNIKCLTTGEDFTDLLDKDWSLTK